MLIPFRSRSVTRGISQGNSAKNAVVLGEFTTKVPVDGNNTKMKGFGLYDKKRPKMGLFFSYTPKRDLKLLVSPLSIRGMSL